MAKSYKFADERDVEIIDPIQGTLRMGLNSTAVYYRIDRGDSTVRLSIDEDWFKEEDVDNLIAFLQALKEELNG